MADKTQITYEQYLEARLIIATVEADSWWKANRIDDKPVQMPSTEPVMLDLEGLKKHVGYGETKIRKLIKEGKLPEPIDYHGRNRWVKAEVDAALAKDLKHIRKQPSNGINKPTRRWPKAD